MRKYFVERQTQNSVFKNGDLHFSEIVNWSSTSFTQYL